MGSCFIKQESAAQAAIWQRASPELPYNTSKDSQSAFMESSNEKHGMSPTAFDSASEKSYMIE